MPIWHVTMGQSVDSILEEGLRSRPSPPSYYSPRYLMDEAADEIGQDTYSNWTLRDPAVYFWENPQQAKRRTQFEDYDTLIKVDESKISGQLWCIDTDVESRVYEEIGEPRDISPGDDEWKSVKELVQAAEPYSGRQSGCEIWARSPVSSESIVDVHGLEEF